jgi:hypothetical protein
MSGHIQKSGYFWILKIIASLNISSNAVVKHKAKIIKRQKCKAESM